MAFLLSSINRLSGFDFKVNEFGEIILHVVTIFIVNKTGVPNEKNNH